MGLTVIINNSLAVAALNPIFTTLQYLIFTPPAHALKRKFEEEKRRSKQNTKEAKVKTLNEAKLRRCKTQKNEKCKT